MSSLSDTEVAKVRELSRSIVEYMHNNHPGCEFRMAVISLLEAAVCMVMLADSAADTPANITPSIAIEKLIEILEMTKAGEQSGQVLGKPGNA